jgi:hypothetical protein
MPRLSHAVFSRTRHVIQLTLAVGMSLGLAQLAHSDENTPCSAVQALQPGTCMTYMYAPPGSSSKPTPFVLCNGEYSLCSTTNCTCTSGDCTQVQPGQPGQAQCSPCNVMKTGKGPNNTILSIRLPAVPASKGINSTISNYGYTPNLEGKMCSPGLLVNCLGVEKCTPTSSGSNTTSCTCPVTPGGQYILAPQGTDVPCDTLRSGAPIDPTTRLPATQSMDNALNTAMQCIPS